MVVDRDVDPVPAYPAMPVPGVNAVDPVTAARADPAEHLRIEVDELAWSFALGADDRRSGFESVESSAAFAPEDRAHRAPGKACLPGEDVRTDAQLTPTNTQASDKVGRMTPGLVVDRARTVGQDAGLGATPPLRPWSDGCVTDGLRLVVVGLGLGLLMIGCAAYLLAKAETLVGAGAVRSSGR